MIYLAEHAHILSSEHIRDITDTAVDYTKVIYPTCMMRFRLVENDNNTISYIS